MRSANTKFEIVNSVPFNPVFIFEYQTKNCTHNIYTIYGFLKILQEVLVPSNRSLEVNTPIPEDGAIAPKHVVGFIKTIQLCALIGSIINIKITNFKLAEVQE
jgi:hypothetical protein